MNQKITLYSNGCPKCKVLKNKLLAKNISFVEIDSFKDLEELGIQTIPVMKLEDDESDKENIKFMNFLDSNNWINDQEENI